MATHWSHKPVDIGSAHPFGRLLSMRQSLQSKKHFSDQLFTSMGIVQLRRILGLGPSGRRFESCYPYTTIFDAFQIVILYSYRETFVNRKL